MTHKSPDASGASVDAHYERLLVQERIIQSAAMSPNDVPSCMNLFDRWATCFALVPQFRNVYRYGTFNDCAGKLDDFKFCLTLKGLDDAQRREAFIERKARQMARRRLPGGDTSEAIWEIRDNPIIEPALVDKAFLPTSQADAKMDKQV